MTGFTNPLENIKIASPCSANWDSMLGNNRQRYCGECKLHVYNLSGMSRTEANNLLIRSEGRLCVRYFRRADGSVITEDCPVGWKAAKQKMSRYWTAVFSLVFGLVTGLGVNAFFSRTDFVTEPMMGAIPPEEFRHTNRPVPDEPIATMGTVAPEPAKSRGKLSNFDRVKREVLKKGRR